MADRIEAAPAAPHFGQQFLAAADAGRELRARALHSLGDDLGDEAVLEERGPQVRDLVLERDPQVSGDGFGGRDRFPVARHRVLHPAQIDRVVDVSHVVDVDRLDGDAMREHQRLPAVGPRS